MPTYLSMTLMDGFGRTTTKRVELTNQLLLSDYRLNAEEYMAAFVGVSDLQIVKASIQTDDELSIPAQDPTGSNIDVGATFSGYLGDANAKRASHKVPGISLSFVGPLGTIDLTQTAIATYLDLMGDPPDNKVRISDGEWVEEWIQGTLDK